MDKKVIFNKIRYLIQNRYSFEEICKELELSEKEVLYLIECMKEYGISITVSNGEIVKHERPKTILEPYKLETNKYHIKIGLLGDTHLASIVDDIPTLKMAYDIIEDNSVDYVFHCGDLTEGVLGVPNYERYLKEDTYTGQARYVIDRYPKYSGKTYAVTGNHDDAWTKLTGGEIISDISNERSDIVYLGGNGRMVFINGLKIQILHGDFDRVNRCFFREKKYLKSVHGKEKPHILHTGHKHISKSAIMDGTYFLRSGTIRNAPINRDSKVIKNEKAMFFADIYFNDDGLPENIRVKKRSFSK